MLFSIHAEGLENIPATGAVVLAANHISAWDPLALAVLVKRQVRFMAKKELFRNALLRALMRGLGAFPVNRGQPDVTSFKEALRTLKNGEVLGIFPEGTRSRSGELLEAYNGAAVLAIRSNAVLVPIGIKGHYRFRGKIRVNVGAPIELPEVAPDRELVASELTSVLTSRLGSLTAGSV
jgi:1-acyl-sn-glycerol-3-phosphate acyltransferase